MSWRKASKATGPVKAGGPTALDGQYDHQTDPTSDAAYALRELKDWRVSLALTDSVNVQRLDVIIDRLHAAVRDPRIELVEGAIVGQFTVEAGLIPKGTVLRDVRGHVWFVAPSGYWERAGGDPNEYPVAYVWRAAYWPMTIVDLPERVTA